MKILGLFGGSRCGLFCLGIFTQRANGPGAIIGALAGAAAVFFVERYTDIHLLLYAFVGITVCCLCGYFASAMFRASTKSIEGLTIHTLNSECLKLRVPKVKSGTVNFSHFSHFSSLLGQGQGGYNNYRIPALLTTQAGTLPAFCEGREGGDSSDIDLLVRRSEDGGQSWAPKQVVWDQGRNVCGNPCPVQDRDTGVIWLLLTWNDSTDSGKKLHDGTSKDTRRVYVCSSQDDGHTWSKPIEITATTKKKDWWWYATGPGVGIQLRQGPHEGRLVIPCDHTDRNGHGSHVIYSDDHGKSWQLGGSVSGGCNECQVVELADGQLMLNMRMQENGQGKRGIATSEDGGLTWSELELDPVLIEPVCQASFLRYTLASEHGRNRLLFSNPASAPSPRQSRGDRVKMTVRLSYDEGRTWPISKLLHEGPSAYSCLAILPDGDIGCLYEGGETRYGEIVFARFSLEWLTNGADRW